VTGVDVEIVLGGDWDDGQLDKLRVAAEGCRISRALNVPVALRLSAAPHA
jgi:hypothetical protein